MASDGAFEPSTASYALVCDDSAGAAGVKNHDGLDDAAVALFAGDGSDTGTAATWHI